MSREPISLSAVEKACEELAARDVPYRVDGAENNQLIAALPAMVKALRNVLAVHVRIDYRAFPGCSHCHSLWPCATFSAISDAGIDTGEAGT